MVQQDVIGRVVSAELDAECLGNRGGGDVVMGWADAAGGEDEVIARAHIVEGFDDCAFDVGDYSYL